MGYKSCPADPDVFMKPEARADGSLYYSYLLVYVDDCLLVHDEPSIVMEELKRRYDLKGDAYGKPERYLGANVKMFQFDDGSEFWSMGPQDYVTETVKMVKGWSESDGRTWNKSGKNAMNKDYSPELDESRLLDDELATRYQQMIGILRWAVELGRIDIITEVTLLSSFNTSPREGHLEAAYQVL